MITVTPTKISIPINVLTDDTIIHKSSQPVDNWSVGRHAYWNWRLKYWVKVF